MIPSMTLLMTELAFTHFGVNNRDVTDTLLPQGAAEVGFHNTGS